MKNLIPAMGLALGAGWAGPAQAALLTRASGQAYYDDQLHVTWVADANLASTSGYDSDGFMTWPAAQAWIASLNAAGYLGSTDWRLPTVVDSGTPGCDFGYSGTDCGYNVDLANAEMAHLFYSTLANAGFHDTSGTPVGCGGSACLVNTGPFANLQAGPYWYGTEYAANTSNAWNFGFGYGTQSYHDKLTNRFAVAVRDGDLPVVPAPPAGWLLITALGGLLTRFARA